MKQSPAELYRVIQSNTDSCRVVKNHTESYEVKITVNENKKSDDKNQGAVNKKS